MPISFNCCLNFSKDSNFITIIPNSCAGIRLLILSSTKIHLFGLEPNFFNTYMYLSISGLINPISFDKNTLSKLS